MMVLDFMLCLIWLPIGVSKTYQFRTASEAFFTTSMYFQPCHSRHPALTKRCKLDNGTGATPGWNWMLSFLFAASTLTGFDAAAHVAEETKRERGVMPGLFF